MNGTNGTNNYGVTVTGPPAAVAAALAALNGPTANTGSCAACSGASPSAVGQGVGALAAQSTCLTTGTSVKMCAPGQFPAYTAEAPLFVTHTPTRRDFDVPCAVAATFFSEVAIKCRSTNSIIGSVTIGDPNSCCEETQIETETSGSAADITLSAPPGCEEFTPGLLLTVGFSNNVSPGPVTFSIDVIGSDGCPESMDSIRVMMTQLGAGTLALIFNCDEEQRLYPLLARLRTDVVQIPEGTVLPGGAVPAPGVLFANEEIVIHVVGPAGTTITFETLAWNHPTLSCLWQNALGPMGL